MDISACAQVSTWLETYSSNTYLPTLLMLHIAECTVCQGRLSILLAELLASAPPATWLSCTHCQADIAAYIDLERAGGSACAAQTFSAAWWHIGLCAECGEIYRIINLLA